MRWGSTIEKVPLGAERSDVVFALFPTPLSSGRWVWLEHYARRWRYVRDIGNGDMFEDGDPGWVVVERF